MKRCVFLLLSLVLCSLLFVYCKKNPFDYRNKFTGDYNFIVHENSWIVNSGTTELIYSSKGKISLGTLDNTIVIQYSDNSSIEVYVYEDGTLENDDHYNPLQGEFESTTTLKLWFRKGGLGAGSYIDVSGSKSK